jgi:hypothetical protein
MRKIIQLLAVCLFMQMPAAAQLPDFYSEELRFAIDSQYFYMQGDFFIAANKNNTPYFPLSFPVPDGTMGLIDTFSVYDYSSNSFIKSSKGKSAFYFPADLSTDSIVLHIKYRQRIAGTALCYIITTVQQWGRPLAYASYALEIPEYWEASSFSLDNPHIVNIQGSKIFMWERINFMPSSDFCFTIKPAAR